MIDRLASAEIKKAASQRSWAKAELKARSALLPQKLADLYIQKKLAQSPEIQDAVKQVSDLDVETNALFSTMRALKLEYGPLEQALTDVRQQMREMHGRPTASTKVAQGIQARLLPKKMVELAQKYRALAGQLKDFPTLSTTLGALSTALQNAAPVAAKTLQQRQQPAAQPAAQPQAPAQPRTHSDLASLNWARLHLERAVRVASKYAEGKASWAPLLGGLKQAQTELVDLRKVKIEAKKVKRKKRPTAIGHDPWSGKRPTFDSAYRKIDVARGQLAKLLAKLSDGSLVRRDIQYVVGMLEKSLEAMKRA